MSRYKTETKGNITHVIDTQGTEGDRVITSFHGAEGRKHANQIANGANENRAERCPRCGHLIPNDEMAGVYCGALSRRDNETEICSECGSLEAFEDWEDAHYPKYEGEPYWIVEHEIS